MADVKSLDPRVGRLPVIDTNSIAQKAPLDQFGTYEVFVQPKDGKPFQHEGIVHAPNIEMAYVLAKETFTRRFTCTSLYVADTRDVFVSPLTEGDQNAYDRIDENISPDSLEEKQYEIYHLVRRGKQHIHAGIVKASTPAGAMAHAKKTLNSKMVYNIWAIQTACIRFTSPEEKEFWLTLPEKKFRDAADYKGGDKLKDFLERLVK
jgi:ring-1,2-phenylacetyl-CoA epoxidase subunit PaaB